MANTTFPSPPPQYRAEFVRSDGQWTRQFHDGDKSRVESYNHFGGCQVTIRRLDLEVGWSFGASSKEVVEVDFTREDADSTSRLLKGAFEWSVGETTSFEGRPAVKYVARLRQSQEIAETILFDLQNGIPLQTLTFNLLGEQCLEIRAREIQVGELDQNMFELPEGHTVRHLGRKRSRRPGWQANQHGHSFASLSEILCVGHSMSTRSMNATQNENYRYGGQSGPAAIFNRAA